MAVSPITSSDNPAVYQSKLPLKSHDGWPHRIPVYMTMNSNNYNFLLCLTTYSKCPNNGINHVWTTFHEFILSINNKIMVLYRCCKLSDRYIGFFVIQVCKFSFSFLQKKSLWSNLIQCMLNSVCTR